MSDTPPITRACLSCGVAPRRPCLDASGRALAHFHRQRVIGALRTEADLEKNRIRNREKYRSQKAVR